VASADDAINATPSDAATIKRIMIWPQSLKISGYISGNNVVMSTALHND
jgi:hypothetical protein